MAASIAVACHDEPPVAGLPTTGPAPVASIIGTLRYDERTALTNQAVAIVSLQDASRQDTPATVLAQQTIADPGQVPIRFALDYPRDAIDPRGLYVLRAQIHDRDQLLFSTDRHTPVLTRGADDEAHLLLVAVGDPNPAALSPAAADSSRLLRGTFRYLERPAMEGNRSEINLIVDFFKNLHPDKACVPEGPHAKR